MADPPGAQLYEDCGRVEMATGECSSPTELCNSLFRGEHILGELARQLSEQHHGVVSLTRTTNGYGCPPTTCACHENYAVQNRALFTGGPARGALVTFLATRSILTGAGGIDARNPGISFQKSPRCLWIDRVVSDSSTRNRGVIHSARKESFAKGLDRLHLLIGDANGCPLSNYLKLGTTALVLVLLQVEKDPCLGNVALAKPVQTMHRLSADIQCHLPVLPRSDPRTQIEIQRWFAERVEQRLDHPAMPNWAEQVVHHWKQLLDDLERGPLFVADRLEWAMKYRLFRKHIEDAGFPWKHLSAWNHLWKQVAVTRQSRENSGDVFSEINVDDRWDHHASQRGLDWEAAAQFQQIRRDLCQMDTVFGHIGPESPLIRMQQQGLVSDTARLIGMKSDPDFPQSRARVRAELIVELQNRRNEFDCDWHGVFGPKQHKDLSDPYQTRQPRWKRHARKKAPKQRPFEIPRRTEIQTRGRRLLNRAVAMYRSGENCRDVVGQLRCITVDLLSGEDQAGYWRLWAMLAARQGKLRPEDYLDRIAPDSRSPLQQVCDCFSVCRWQSAFPNLCRAAELFNEGRQCWQQTPHDPACSQFFELEVDYLVKSKQLESLDLVMNDHAESREMPDQLRARTLASLGEANRLSGDVRRARSLLDRAESIQRAHNFFGDWSSMTLIYLAKASSHFLEQAELLDRSCEFCRDSGNRVGETRVLLMQLRILPLQRSEQQRIVRRIKSIMGTAPAIRADCKLQQVVESWQQWALDGEDSEDEFGGL